MAPTLSACLALACSASAVSLSGLGPAPANDPRWTDFQPPGEGDVRSPCPGLNSLANHGFLHHDGKNLSLLHLVEGLAAGLNVGPDFTIAIGTLGLLGSPEPLLGAFDLNDLNQHNFPLEHDGSLSRQDAYFGNDQPFHQSIFDQVLSYYQGDSVTNLKAASDARYHRITTAKSEDPTFTYGVKEFVLSYGETSLYLQTMGSSDTTGVANLDYIKELFEKERLPYELGWRPRAEPVTLLSLGTMVLSLFAVSPEPLPEGLDMTVDSYKDLLYALVGGSEIIGNLTEIITTDLRL